MKKFTLFLLAGMCAVFMISCQNENSSENNTEEEKVVDTTQEKIELYKKVLVGTSWEGMDYSSVSPGKEKLNNHRNISFSDSSITINGTPYSFDLSKDLFYMSEAYPDYADYSNKWVNEEWLADGANLVIHANNMYYCWKNYKFKNSTNTDKLWMYIGLTSEDDYLCTRFKQVTSSSDSSSSGSGSGSGSSTSTETVTVSGSYSATGAQSGATTTFTDGTWKFSYMSSSETGSYSQSGNELTIKCSSPAGSYSAVFTVSKGDGDSIVKLTGKSGGAFATVVSSAFHTTDSDALTKGNVTLTKN